MDLSNWLTRQGRPLQSTYEDVVIIGHAFDTRQYQNIYAQMLRLCLSQTILTSIPSSKQWLSLASPNLGPLR